MRRALSVLLLLALSCADDAPVFDGPVTIELSERPPELLSGMRLLTWDGARIRYNDRVVPYELNTPLFSDYALKARAIYVPENGALAYRAEGPLEFPVGSVIVKTFYYADDMRVPDENVTLIETRVLRLTETGWESWPYIWNDEQSDAELRLGGETRAISFIDPDGVAQSANYLIPQRNQCSGCHERNVGEGGETAMTPIGPAARHLNRAYPYARGNDNQLRYLAERGMLTGLPALEEVDAAYDFRIVEAMGADAIPAEDVNRAARDYLHVNCAHCHDALGPQGVTSQLFLNHDSTDPFRLGVCKRPGSAGEGNGGLVYDIVPGDPDNSILLFRMETTEVGAIMPLLGRSVTHSDGARLIRRWIAGMDPQRCDE